MQYTLFIADLHLDEKHAETLAFFDNFLANEAQKAEALYILGDFFELWIGDDDDTHFIRKIKNSLLSLSKRQIPVYFIHGNRDFLIGKRFERETQCKILPEFSRIQLYDESFVLLHGDALCTRDRKHMKFRRLTQNIFLRNLFLLLPLSLRRYIGRRLRSTSRKHHAYTSNDHLEVVPETVKTILKNSQTNNMIHGHIHQAKIFQFPLTENQKAERIVLGSWEKHGCALKCYANGKKEMLFFN